MAEKQICCCKSQVWTKVIAWLQIIGDVLVVVFYALALATTVNLLTVSDNPDIKQWLSPQEINEIKNHLTAILVAAFGVLLNILSFVMGIVLLRGALSRNTGLIRAWMVFTIILIILQTIMAFIKTFETEGARLVGQLIGIVVGLAIQWFFVWVVGIHKNEIETQGELMELDNVQNAVLKASI